MQDARRSQANGSNARAVLIALAEAHEEVRRELAHMEHLQAGTPPGAERWAHARWKLSRASRRRRVCVEQAYPLALQQASAAERVRIAQLQAQEPVMRRASHDHVARWTPNRITADWPGYCAASRLVRRGMADRLQAEQDILFPILTRRG